MSGQTRGAKIVVLGAGMVGSAIAADLCREHQVVSVDADRKRVEALAARHPLTAHVADLADAGEVRRVIADADLVIGAVPGFMGYATLRTVIEAGKNVVDISFFDEDPFTLDALAQERGVTAVMDCGVAPGLSNMILGYHAKCMSVAEFRCLVGGLPAKRSWPWQYKAPFSPIDVLEEYTRPARLVEDGRIVTKPALSDSELVEVEPIGTLEAFNTDGLRTLLKTVSVPNMAEKTLRYPGHIEYVRVLRESGFLDTEPVNVGGVAVRPIDMAAALLFPRWRLEEGEEEFTAMQIAVRGQEAGAGAPLRLSPLRPHRCRLRHLLDGAHDWLHLHGCRSAGARRAIHPEGHLPAGIRRGRRGVLRARAGRPAPPRRDRREVSA